MGKRALRGLLVGAAVFLATAILDSLSVFDGLEWRSWDARQHAFADPARADKNIVLVAIDQPSLDAYERQQALSWPWPRELYAELLEYLNAGGAAAVMFDLIFSETSPYGIEDDVNLAKTVRRAGNVFLPVFAGMADDAAEAEAAAVLRAHALPVGSLPSSAVRPLRSVTTPIASLAAAARGLGNVQFEADSDSIYRRLPLFFSIGGQALPSLPAAAVRFLRPDFDFGRVPFDRGGAMILRYHGPAATYATYSIAALINSQAQIREGTDPQLDPREFEGKLVIVGGTAPGLLDFRPSPMGGAYPGMEILATAIDNLLHDDSFRKASGAASLALLLVAAVVTAVGASVLRRIRQIAAFFAAVLAVQAAAAGLTFRAGLWLDVAAPLFAILGAFIAAALLSYALEGKQKRFIKSAFRHYLSPDVIDRILKDPGHLRLGGEKREITAYFSDVAGFTSVSEKLTPEELVALLNEYLSAMTDIILETGGTLDKYEGDAVIAFWNAPLDLPDHAERACRAALRCQRKLEALRPVFRERFGHELEMRIGLNSGPVVVGNMGSAQRFDYTALGDTMNLASRLEGACKVYRVRILAGQATRDRAAGAFVFREVDVLRVVGKRVPVRVYELVAEKGEAVPEALTLIDGFELAREAYRKRDWRLALNLFQALDDPAAAIYARRCETFLVAPPPEDWDGVFELGTK